MLDIGSAFIRRDHPRLRRARHEPVRARRRRRVLAAEFRAHRQLCIAVANRHRENSRQPGRNGSAVRRARSLHVGSRAQSGQCVAERSRAGGDREKVLCSELGKGDGTKQRLDGPGDVAMWKFSTTMGLFNSGELETCSGKGYVALALNGKRDEAQLKETAVTLARTVLNAL